MLFWANSHRWKVVRIISIDHKTS
ncbi:hypothetical protein NC653_035505 [Populus alba x Populus x berolinensis]|uniref:Uncharacterized protein n=1 Tax=Populus alba x Populus x berolinensis TaxID=444605 RepID=A0AAD6LQA5_9ROSI|nr:hypothetical protein NC653_035505 [Populus alba x Populus x berolinensis]